MASDHRGRGLHAGKRTDDEVRSYNNRLRMSYSLLQSAHQDMSPSAHLMHESEVLFNNKYLPAAKDMAEHPETAKSRITLAKGGLIL